MNIKDLNAKKLLSWGLQLLVVLVAIWLLELFLNRDSLGEHAPAIEAITLDQRPFSSQQLRGEPAMIHFWASWCPVCEVEQGTINKLASAYPVITIAMQSGTDEELRSYLRSQEVSYPVINDEDGALSRQYEVKAVPVSFITDASGKVRFATRGYTSALGLQLRLWLARFF